MLRAALLPLGLVLALGVSAPASASPLTGRLLVTLRAPQGGGAHAAAVEARAVAARAFVRPVGAQVPQIGLLSVRPGRGSSITALARRLRADAAVSDVSIEHRATAREQPNDPALATAETAPNTAQGTPEEWWPQREGFFAAWDRSHGRSVLVALVDSGIDGAHPAFSGKVRHAANFDPDPADGSAMFDRDGHGTHVASLACGGTGDGVGIASAGYDCGLSIEKTDFGDGGVAAAIVDAVDVGARVINMSFGTDDRVHAPAAIRRAVGYAVAHDVVLVAAASDKSDADQPVTEQGDPANLLQPTATGPKIGEGIGLSVTAAGFDDRHAAFAGIGSQISLAAYGTYSAQRGVGPAGLLGAFPANLAALEVATPGPPSRPACVCRTSLGGDNRYAYLQGTSMATAVVSGAAALVRDVNPDLAALAVIRVIKQAARRPAGAGWTPGLGWGILDAAAAVQAATTIDATPPRSTLRAPRVVHSRSVLLRVTAADAGPPGVAVTGVHAVHLYGSANGAPARLLAVTLGAVAHVRVRRGATYAFYSRAEDRAGNLEAPPQRADAHTRVALRPTSARGARQRSASLPA